MPLYFCERGASQKKGWDAMCNTKVYWGKAFGPISDVL